MVRNFIGLACVLALFATADLRSTAADPTPTESNAQKKVVAGSKNLTQLAYVTSKSHTKTECVRGMVNNDGSFDLTYKFHYRDSDNDPQNYTLTFQFAQSGDLKEVKTVSHSSFWPPFNAITIAGGIVDAAVRELDK